MTEKWHIGKSGKPTRCRAVKQPCPLGGQHYESAEKAQQALNQKYEKKNGFLPAISGANYRNYVDLENENKQHVAHVIREVSGIKTAGFEYECFASATVADRMGLDQIAVINSKGKAIGVSINSENKAKNKAFSRATNSMEKYYESQGVSIGDKSLLARVVYYSSDPTNDKILVQSGGPNVLDAAIIEADKVVDIIEVKKLHSGGAQMPSTAIEISETGEISDDVINRSSSYMRSALKGLKIQDADGHNFKVDFGSKENNERYPLYYFVDEYKSKGAKTFLYTSANGREIKEIDLRGETSEIVDEMINKGIYANIKLRANAQKRSANKEDIYRFNFHTGGSYFKDGYVPVGSSFRLGDLDKNKFTVSNGNIRIGGYVLPIKEKEYNEDLIINKKDMQAFRLTLIGDIKVK